MNSNSVSLPSNSTLISSRLSILINLALTSTFLLFVTNGFLYGMVISISGFAEAEGIGEILSGIVLVATGTYLLTLPVPDPLALKCHLRPILV